MNMKKSDKKIAIIALVTFVILAISVTTFMYITKTEDKEVETISKKFYWYKNYKRSY